MSRASCYSFLFYVLIGLFASSSYGQGYTPTLVPLESQGFRQSNDPIIVEFPFDILSTVTTQQRRLFFRGVLR